MYAGAARVVVSLWSVNDKAIADLNDEVLRNDAEARRTPGGSVARGAGRDVEADAMAIALLLGGVHDAGRAAITTVSSKNDL